MFVLRCLRHQKSGKAASGQRRQWEERVAGLLAAQEEKAANSVANHFEAKYEKKQFTPLHEAFPEMNASAFAAMAKRQAAAESPLNAKVHITTVVGPPNAGKSSLINALTHKLYSAEGRSSGTTAGVLRAYTTVGTSQLIFLDTPGLMPPKGPVRYQRQRDMAPMVWDTLQAADAVLACIPVHNNGFLDTDHKATLQHAARRAAAREMPIDLAITMMDRVSTPKLKDFYFSMRAEIEGLGIPIRKSFETSTRTSTGLIEMKDYFASVARRRPWEAEERGRDHVLAATEIMKQAFHSHLPVPLPHEAATQIVGWTRRPNGTTEVFVEVFFGRPSFMSVFLSKIGAISADCNRMATREFEKNFVFQFQAFVSNAGVRND